MSRALVVLNTPQARATVKDWAHRAPFGTRVTFQGPRRTLPQNDRFWAMLTRVAAQLPWHGMRLSAEDWKVIFITSLQQEVRMVPNLAGTGFVQLGRSSSDLSRAEMADLIDLISAFGAEHGVDFDSDGNGDEIRN